MFFAKKGAIFREKFRDFFRFFRIFLSFFSRAFRAFRVFRVFRRTQRRCKFEKLVLLLHLRSPQFSIDLLLVQGTFVIRCMIRCWAFWPFSTYLFRGSRLGVFNHSLPCPCTFLIVEMMKKPVAGFVVLSIHDDLTAIKKSGFYLDYFSLFLLSYWFSSYEKAWQMK